jgi:hypothetical protein
MTWLLKNSGRLKYKVGLYLWKIWLIIAWECIRVYRCFSITAKFSSTHYYNLSSVRYEACRTLRNKKHEYLKDKMNELEANSKNKTVRDLYRGRDGEKIKERYFNSVISRYYV